MGTILIVVEAIDSIPVLKSCHRFNIANCIGSPTSQRLSNLIVCLKASSLFMHIDRQSQLSILFRLRQELGMPINTIIGYSEIIIEEIEELNREVEYLAQLEQIRECGVELLASMKCPAQSSNFHRRSCGYC